MIGVINQNSTQTLNGQLAIAQNATLQLSPGEPYPSEGTPTSSGTSTSYSYSSTSLSGGAIAGIVIGVLVILALAGLIFYLCGRNRSLASVIKYSRPPPGKASNIPQPGLDPLPMTSAYSPSFSMAKSHQSPTSISHPSWQSGGYPAGVVPPRAMSPDHTTSYFNNNPYQNTTNSPPTTYPNAPYDPPNAAEQRPGHVRLQSSPTEVPWSPNGFGLGGNRYEQIPQQNHEMDAEESMSTA